MSDRLCEGRVAIVTGAGRGIGREHALSLASQGAKVVVNDLGGNIDGTGGDQSPAQQVVEEIKGMGGEAVANGDNVASWEGAQRLINTAIETFGDLHAVVNNAGILRDRVLINMTEEEWDAVIAVHLKGTFATSRHASAWWRDRSKAGETNDARIINTTSVSGIYANPGQTNYGAAKAGIAAFTQIAAQEVVAEIQAAGGEAAANTDDISTWDGAAALVQQAIDTFGGLDVLINNAGILRDRMIFSMSEEEWDLVVRVHLKGTFATSRHASAWWRTCP